MAVITSHALNGTDGTHAAGIGVTLTNRTTGEMLIATKTDGGGRVSIEVDEDRIDPTSTYELVLATGAYWGSRAVPRKGAQIMEDIVLRIAMPNPAGHYHLPVIISPNSYSAWWST